MVTLNESQTFLCVVQLSFSSLQLPVLPPCFVFLLPNCGYLCSRGSTGKMERSSGPEVSITNLGDCKREHRESLRFVREFSWFVFSSFPTIFSDRRGRGSFPRVKSFASARRREIDSIQIQNCSTRSTRRLYRAPLSASPRRISSLIVRVYPRGKNLRLAENSYETVRLVAEYLGQCTRNLSIHAARLHRKRLYYTC